MLTPGQRNAVKFGVGGLLLLNAVVGFAYSVAVLREKHDVFGFETPLGERLFQAGVGLALSAAAAWFGWRLVTTAFRSTYVRCDSCSKFIRLDARICPHCRTEQPARPAVPDSESARPGAISFRKVVETPYVPTLIVIAVGAVIFFLMNRSDGKIDLEAISAELTEEYGSHIDGVRLQGTTVFVTVEDVDEAGLCRDVLGKDNDISQVYVKRFDASDRRFTPVDSCN